jgi:hypothetical protein
MVENNSSDMNNIEAIEQADNTPSPELVSPQIDIMEAWATIRPNLEKILTKLGNTHQHQDVLRMVLEGRMHLWFREEAYAITEFEIYPRKKFLNIFAAGGKMDKVKEIEKVVVEFAQKTKCDGVVAFGRKGWTKDLGEWEIISHRLYRSI